MFMYLSGVSLCFLNKGATSFWNKGHRNLNFAFLWTSPVSSAYHLCGATQTQHRGPLCIVSATYLHAATGRGLPGVPFFFQLNTKVLPYSKQRRLNIRAIPRQWCYKSGSKICIIKFYCLGLNSKLVLFFLKVNKGRACFITWKLHSQNVFHLSSSAGLPGKLGEDQVKGVEIIHSPVSV